MKKAILCSQVQIAHADDSQTSTSLSSSDCVSDNEMSFRESAVKKSKGCSVRFDTVQFRNYGMILGDNPCCYYGPPVTIGWDYDESAAVPLDLYEETREPRRNRVQMMMNCLYRRQILSYLNGYSDKDLDRVIHEMNKIKKQRHNTACMMPYHKIEEISHSAIRKISRLINGKTKN
jgi:hypothetical protein